VHHARGLRALLHNDAQVDQILRDFESADLSPAEIAMLRYARKLTETPGAMKAEDVDCLREVEWSDTAILDICQVAAYFNFVNRLADGLGVPLESNAE
jgi:uncharacterized peroxidase-related enzyme